MEGEIEAAPRTYRLGRDGSWTLILNTSSLFANLITGILIARVLGTAGRGQMTAIAIAPQLVGWIFASGCAQATSYHQARHPSDAPRLLATWAVILAPLSVAALIFGEFILPHLLAAQDASTLHLARIYMVVVLSVLASDLVYGVLVGDGDFLFFNVLRVAQPAAIALMYVALWRFELLTVRSALVTGALPGFVALVIAATRLIRRHGLAKPSWRLGLSTLWFGTRAHGATISDLLNSRLDLMIIPAFLTASSVGIYAVATTLSGLVITLASALSLLVLPVAASAGRRSSESVNRLIRTSFGLALALGFLIAALAPQAVHLVYGPSFQDSVRVVWLLLPGTILYACAAVLRPALYGANRPLAASGSYALGMFVTILGLLVFLRPGGIVAAAIVSSLAYSTVFIASLILYCRLTRVGIRAFAPTQADVVAVRAYLARFQIWISSFLQGHR